MTPYTPLPDSLSSTHALGGQAEDGDRRNEEDEVVELMAPLVLTSLERRGGRTAVREYSFSSTSVRASTKRRRKLGRLACDILALVLSDGAGNSNHTHHRETAMDYECSPKREK